MRGSNVSLADLLAGWGTTQGRHPSPRRRPAGAPAAGESTLCDRSSWPSWSFHGFWLEPDFKSYRGLCTRGDL